MESGYFYETALDKYNSGEEHDLGGYFEISDILK